MSESAVKTPVASNGLPKSRLRTVLATTREISVCAAQESWATAVEMAKAPFRCGGRIAFSISSDAKRLYQHLAPALIVGVPVAIAITASGLTVVAVPGALAVRGARSADSILGSVTMGAVGFLAGTALLVYVYELAVLWAVCEILALTAQSAERVRSVRLAPAGV
jgi:hypothetical protein